MSDVSEAEMRKGEKANYKEPHSPAPEVLV